MEDFPDLLSITGILTNAKAKYGDMSKIIHKSLSGNEEKITYLLQSLKTFLQNKNYFEDNLPKKEHENYMKKLCLILIVNTEFSAPFNIEEYAHLIYNVPKISKYVLSRLIIGLNLTEFFCSVVEEIPLIYSCELFDEFLPCLDKVKIQQLLTDTYFILNSIGKILLNNQDMKYSDAMDTLLRPVPAFFFKFSRINIEHLPNLKKKIHYEQAGYVLQKLLRLLLFCHQNNILYGLFIDRLIEATTIVARGVPLNMYIYWAEIDLESGQSLQNEISEQAYFIIEKYQQFKPAAEMLESLKPFASKPKDIKEQISMADTEKMVFMVNKADDNQKQWLEALIFSSSFSNSKAIECISKWSHLCQEEDVSRLLNQSLKVDSKDVVNLALKCVSHLNLQQIIVVVTRHFYNNGFVVLNNDVQGEIILLFNMLKDTESVDESTIMKLLLLILQNPEGSIDFILSECVRNVFYVTVLENWFMKLRDVLKIRDICLNSLQKVMNTALPTVENYEIYAKLLQSFLNIGLCTNEVLIMKIINPLLTLEHNTQELIALLKILNVLTITIQLNKTTNPFIENMFKLMALRPKFMNYNPMSQGIVQEVVNIISNKIHRNMETDVSIQDEDLQEDKYISYYMTWLQHPEKNCSLLQHLISDFKMENHTKVVCGLMQVLPDCVTEEWIAISMEILQKSSFKDLLGVLKDMTILLSQFVQSQEEKENYSALVQALKYCLQQMGIVIKNIMSTYSTLEDEIIVTDSLVDLMSHLPVPVKQSEGFALLSLMSEKSLKNLGKDKMFVSKICKIKDVKICQVLAQRILN